jgi:PhzF family phenazine biosynthesis protein
MSIPIVQVDAFTAVPFHGNPAAVCILTEAKDPAWMQNIALEMNLAETAFLEKQADGYNLRWFTPAVEVDLCGHATLASAHVLWEDAHLRPDQQARFHTRSGLLTADRKGDWIELDFPIKKEVAAGAPAHLIEALGVQPKYVGKNQFDYLVEVEEAELHAMRPNFSLLRTLPVRGVIVTSLSSDPQYDFVSRFFAPGSGIDEDPVTGSAHSALTPFWAARLGKTTLFARQASPRGGVLKLTLNGDRVLIGGQAVTVLRGELLP